ncbi:hypothetical protein G8V07_11575 [Clostridium botulinum D/C]|uniref:hypothetical protein n=1 Tax=Clostridium botulinum TaxID=1491 RepID=UPI001E5A3E18|nr:hypothetical protein [Clostridium botulinum]MCD3319523.1 hypothetical protein [Clostridium botulinum D/C]MCD3324388.1 hypothetical protein [Clostridium botulinum D/C]MCD3327820.1 hypothetical protein [Clostridium botulinum D/C]
MLNRCKTYEFSKKGWEQAKQDGKKIKNNRVMDLVVYSTLLGLTIGNIVKNDTFLKIVACDGTKRAIKSFIIH